MSCFTEFGPSIALTARAAARFVKTANGVLDDIDLFIRALMLDPPLEWRSANCIRGEVCIPVPRGGGAIDGRDRENPA